MFVHISDLPTLPRCHLDVQGLILFYDIGGGGALTGEIERGWLES